MKTVSPDFVIRLISRAAKAFNAAEVALNSGNTQQALSEIHYWQQVDLVDDIAQLNRQIDDNMQATKALANTLLANAVPYDVRLNPRQAAAFLRDAEKEIRLAIRHDN